MYFVVDLTALGLALLFLIVYSFIRRQQKNVQPPALLFSDLTDLKASNTGWKVHYANLPTILKRLALVCFLIAFIDPHLNSPPITAHTNKGKPRRLATEGSAIFFILDQSGSMSEQIVKTSGSEVTGFASKIELLREVTKEFIEGDPENELPGLDTDLVGLVIFARTAHVISPLTLDHEMILNELSKLTIVKDKSQDGTAIGYAIFKTAHVMAATKRFGEELASKAKPAYEIKGSTMILVTDGFQDPNPEDKNNQWRVMGIEEAAKYAKEQGIHLYIINIDPTIESEEYAPQRRLMIRAAELTGGKFYPDPDPAKLKDIYAEIDRLEKFTLPEQQYLEPQQSKFNTAAPAPIRTLSLYPFFLGIGMFLILMAILLETTSLRRVP